MRICNNYCWLIIASAISVFQCDKENLKHSKCESSEASVCVKIVSKTMESFRKIKQFETSRQKREGGGFMVRRPIGDKIDQCDPFLMLDHLGPVVYGPGEAVGAPDHPHRGFETVTYIIHGENTHQDSAGNSGILGPGWVQWMTAGSGVVHSEMPSERFRKAGGLFEGFQLWVNLPAKDKMVKPRYQDTPPEKIPVIQLPDGVGTMKIIAGQYLGTKAYIETRTPITYLDVHIKAGKRLDAEIPQGQNCFIYVWNGSGHLGSEGKKAKMGDVALLDENGKSFTMSASDEEDMKVMIAAGVPINEPIARYGPFVMNTQEQIYQAFADYQNGKLGKIKGSEERYEITKKAVAQQKKTGKYYNQ